MHRKFIALIVTAALAAAGLSATPARADDATARALAGLAALAIIGAAISADRDDTPGYVSQGNHASGFTGPVPQRPYPNRPAPHYGYRSQIPAHVLPGYCLRDVNTGPGRSERVLGKHCLTTSYRHAQTLPRACEERLWTRARVRNGYDPQCLRSYGYTIARR